MKLLGGRIALKKPKIQRYDIRGPLGTACPWYIPIHLAKIAGYNIYDEPRFRVVRMEHVYRRVGMAQQIFPEGADFEQMLPTEQFIQMLNAGHDVREAVEMAEYHAEHANRPERTIVGEQWIRKYSKPGVAVERWYGPDYYGDCVEWEAMKVDGFPFIGAYPQFGDFESIGSYEGLAYDWPTRDSLTALIEGYFERLREEPEDLRTRLLLRVDEWEKEAERKYKENLDMFDQANRDGVGGLMNRCSLAAQRYRHEICRRVGITEHAGVS